MVSANKFVGLTRAPTRLLLAIAILYLVSVLDVAQADIEYRVEKPSLFSRSSFVPLSEQFRFKRDADSKDDETEDDSRQKLRKTENSKDADQDGDDPDRGDTASDVDERSGAGEIKDEDNKAKESTSNEVIADSVAKDDKIASGHSKDGKADENAKKRDEHELQSSGSEGEPARTTSEDQKEEVSEGSRTFGLFKWLGKHKKPGKIIVGPPPLGTTDRPITTKKPTTTARPTTTVAPVATSTTKAPVPTSTTKAPVLTSTTKAPATQATTVAPMAPTTTKTPTTTKMPTTSKPSPSATTRPPSPATTRGPSSVPPASTTTKPQPSTSSTRPPASAKPTAVPALTTIPPAINPFPTVPPRPSTAAPTPPFLIPTATPQPTKPAGAPLPATTPTPKPLVTPSPGPGPGPKPITTPAAGPPSVPTRPSGATATPVPAVTTPTAKPGPSIPTRPSAEPGPGQPPVRTSPAPPTAPTAKPVPTVPSFSPTMPPGLTVKPNPTAPTVAQRPTSAGGPSSLPPFGASSSSKPAIVTPPPPNGKPVKPSPPSASNGSSIMVEPATMNGLQGKMVTVEGKQVWVVPADDRLTINIRANLTTRQANPDAWRLLEFNGTQFDAREITYFLESHPAHSIHDPRVYFTSERTTRSMVILLRELERVPERLRFAYLARIFNELGRKIASKLNYYAVELVGVLGKTPDQLGNKPEVSMLVDAVNGAFESKDDTEIKGSLSAQLEYDDFVKRVIGSNDDKARVFEASLGEIAQRFSNLISYFVIRASERSLIKLPPAGGGGGAGQTGPLARMVLLLGEALKLGAKSFVSETSVDDRFRVPLDVLGFTNRILNDTLDSFNRNLENPSGTMKRVAGTSVKWDFESSPARSFGDLNPLSDEIGLIGSWGNFLFSGLGSAERVLKLFGSLVSRVPTAAKARWINMYSNQAHLELERTISAFVMMQGMPFNRNASQEYLLDPARAAQILPNKKPTVRDNYEADKNRIPARCYLAGRRWRLALNRALDKFAQRDAVIDDFANRIGAIKLAMMNENGNTVYRLCLPRLEVGLRGWTIDGSPDAPESKKSDSKFPIKNPIDGLAEMRDPFASGVALGFGIGVRVGYNEERNATLEMEESSHVSTQATNHAQQSTDPNGKGKLNSTLAFGQVEYVAMASYRKAATVGARKAFEIALREGYLATLKLSIRAGMDIPLETGSRIAALKSVSFAGQAGQNAGKEAAESFVNGKNLPQDLKQKLIRVGQAHGLLAGEVAGESIGSIVGKAAADEAYRRGIIRGGKVSRAKFHLEEFEAGAKLAFEHGLKEGKKIAASSSLDPSAPRFFRLHKPMFSEKDENDHEVDHWEKDLIPPVTDTIIQSLAKVRNHVPVSGTLKGTYKVAKEVKNGLKRVSFSDVTYNLVVNAQGFIKNNIAYLTLNGTVNNMGILRGSLIARDIFNTGPV